MEEREEKLKDEEFITSIAKKYGFSLVSFIDLVRKNLGSELEGIIRKYENLEKNLRFHQPNLNNGIHDFTVNYGHNYLQIPYFIRLSEGII